MKQQTTNVLKWFDENDLIANPEKFHVMFLLPNKTDQAMNEQLLNNITLDGEPSITLLGMEIDNTLTVNTHIGNLCKKAASQLNVLVSQGLWDIMREESSCSHSFFQALIIVH